MSSDSAAKRQEWVDMIESLVMQSQALDYDETVADVAEDEQEVAAGSETEAEDDKALVKQGFLKKQGGIRKNWKGRFFRLLHAPDL